jgi:hypothetical protein
MSEDGGDRSKREVVYFSVPERTYQRDRRVLLEWSVD